MARVSYSEQQSFRQVFWIWAIIIPISVLSFLGILFGFYQQIIQGEPWGNKPMSDSGVITLTVVVLLGLVAMIWLITSMTLHIEITSEEFRYKFFAYFSKWKVIYRDQVVDYSIEKYTFWKGGGFGYRVDPVSKTVRMILTPAYILTVKIKNQKTIMLSTKNKYGIERAMQKLMSKSENF